MDNATIWSEACRAGLNAGNTAKPKPMVVQQVDLITGEVLKTYDPIPDGVCGFAYVVVKPANSKMARWLKSQNLGHKAYQGGWEVSIREYGQSWERKRAHARAMASVLRDHGINATAYDRLD